MSEEAKKRSPFAQALYDLLFNLEGQSGDAWLRWLNPWYAKIDADGKPTGSYMGGPPSLGGPRGWCDVLEEDSPPPTAEEVAAYEQACKEWVPRHTLGIGVTKDMMLRWCNDEELPEIRYLRDILGFLEIVKFTKPEDQAIIDRFEKALRLPLRKASPFGGKLHFAQVPVTCIAAHVFLEKYGIIESLHDLPLERWDEFFSAAIKIIRQDK